MKKILNKFAILFTVTVPAFVFAQSPFLKPVKDLLGDLEIFTRFLNWFLPAVGVIVFFILVIIFVYQKATGKGGDPWRLVWGIIGLTVLFTVYGLIQLIGALVGVDTNKAKTITAPSLPQVGGVRSGGYYNQ